MSFLLNETFTNPIGLFYVLLCVDVVFLGILTLFVISRIRQYNRQMANERSLAMRRMPPRKPLDIMINKFYHNGIPRYFLKITGHFYSIHQINNILSRKGIIGSAWVSSVFHGGIILMQPIYIGPAGKTGIEVNPVLFHILCTDFEVTTGGGAVTFDNRRLLLCMSDYDEVIIIKPRLYKL